MKPAVPCKQCGSIPKTTFDDSNQTWNVFCMHYDSVKAVFNFATESAAINAWNRLNDQVQTEEKVKS